MKQFLFALCIAVFSFSAIAQENSTATATTYIFVRHAEKVLSNPSDRDPDLTTQGQQRATQLAYVLKDMNIDKVYSTNYKRTMQTAAPTAKQFNLEVEQYNPRELFSEQFQKDTHNKTVLVVGHSNSTPNFVNKILGTPKYQGIDEKDYGKLFIITITNDTIKDIQLNY